MQNRTIQSRTKQGLTVVQLWKSKYSSLQLREFDFNNSGKKIPGRNYVTQFFLQDHICVLQIVPPPFKTCENKYWYGNQIDQRNIA